MYNPSQCQHHAGWYKLIFCTFIFIASFASSVSYADDLPLAVFSLNNYPQQTSRWINNNQRLLSDSYQDKRLMQLKQHYFGTTASDSSPWAMEYMRKFVEEKDGGATILQQEQEFITSFTNQASSTNRSTKKSTNESTNKSNKSSTNESTNEDSSSLSKSNTNRSIGYGINFLPYTSAWSTQIANNMQLAQFTHLKYNKLNRAIATNNLAARVIPTYDPWFLSYKIAGEGYPFDYNQVSKIDIGTPLYVIATTKDKLWSLVSTPYLMALTAWVESSGIGYVDDAFIKRWQQHANIGLVAITKPNTSLTGIATSVTYASTHAGTDVTTYGIATVAAIFPLKDKLHKLNSGQSSGYEILVPLRNNISGRAVIATAVIAKDDAALMPLPATVANIAMLIDRLHGRPYSWGGSNNYNDCSAEIQSIFIPLGYFMPRNSEQQVLAGTVVDLSDKTPEYRQNYLVKNAKPLLTLIYIKGHIMLYIGNTTYYDNKLVPMTYQNMWGFMPVDRSYRFLVGQSVFMPLLLKYPENNTINSQLNNAAFKVVFLNDKIPEIEL